MASLPTYEGKTTAVAAKARSTAPPSAWRERVRSQRRRRSAATKPSEARKVCAGVNGIIPLAPAHSFRACGHFAERRTGLRAFEPETFHRARAFCREGAHARLAA